MDDFPPGWPTHADCTLLSIVRVLWPGLRRRPCRRPFYGRRARPIRPFGRCIRLAVGDFGVGFGGGGGGLFPLDRIQRGWTAIGRRWPVWIRGRFVHRMVAAFWRNQRCGDACVGVLLAWVEGVILDDASVMA